MATFKLFPAIVLSAILFSCSSNDASKKNNTASSDDAAASGISSSFSASIDGAAVTGNGVNEMQIINTAFIYPAAGNSSKRLLFFLNSTKDASDTKPDYSFRFSIPDKEGLFTKNSGDGQPYDIMLDFLTGDFSRYSPQTVTVNVTSITSTRIKGTFAGKFALSGDTHNSKKKAITVSDGKFDIPFSTGNLRPE